MMDTYIYLLPSIIIYIIYFYFIVRRTGSFSIDNIFIISQIIMIGGSLSLLDLSNEIDKDYAILLSYSLPLFIVAAFVGEALFNRWRTIRLSTTTIYKPNRLFYFLLFFSIIITLLYYKSVGYNVFFLGLSSLFSDQSYDIATLRLGSYSGSRYLFPGYVNQFKNTILPSFSVILVIYLYYIWYRHRLTAAVVLSTISLIGLLGTGQRGAFVLFILVLMGFTYYYNRVAFNRAARIAIFVGVPIFFLSSIVLDRSGARNAFSEDPVSAVLGLAGELGNRFFKDNQLSGIVGYRYVAYLPTEDGAEWARAILGLLPGESFRGSDLSGQIFKVLYGSDRGTSPIGLWGSIYYNFGFIGTVIFPLILGLLYKFIYAFFSRKTTMNHGQVLGMSGIFITLGLWISDGPVSVLNTGMLAYVLIYLACSRERLPVHLSKEIL